ncbi:MAG: hypothetical protein JW797_08975 [Bradymonadales bacterium]|nr:hypothetical protein [Bradymonadales bacterium]
MSRNSHTAAGAAALRLGCLLASLVSCYLWSACGDDDSTGADTRHETDLEYDGGDGVPDQGDRDTDDDFGQDPLADPPDDPSDASPDGSDLLEDRPIDSSADLPDGCSPGDRWPVDDTLEGTTLQGVALIWSSEIELCNVWQEGDSLEKELSRKIRLVLPPQDRCSLGQVHLAISRLDDLRIESGPLSTERQEITSSEISSALAFWELSSQADGNSLYARIDHSLGARGTLGEVFSVQRVQGDDRPVDYANPGFDVRFVLEPAGSEETLLLEPCDGEPTYEDAISVLVGTRPEGEVVVTRYWRTPVRDALMGSYPVIITATELWASSSPWQQFLARGLWANTYSASHHNWFENSEVNFTRDLAFYHLVFRSWEVEGQPPGMDAPSRMALNNLNTANLQPGIDLTWITADTGSQRTDSYEVLDPPEQPGGNLNYGEWQRVDGPHFQRLLELDCPNGRVFSVGYQWSSRFQLLACPREAVPGFDLVGLIPVRFSWQPRFTGAFYGAEAIRETIDRGTGEVVFQVDLGESYRTTIQVQNSGGYLVYVWGSDPDNPLDAFWCEEAVLRLDPMPDQILRFEGGDGGVTAHLGRRWGAQGVGQSGIYAPLFLELTFGGAFHRVDAWDRLEYTNTHHNWNDRLVAETEHLDLGWRAEWVFFGEVTGLHYFVWAVDRQTSAEVLSETEVFPVGP